MYFYKIFSRVFWLSLYILYLFHLPLSISLIFFHLSLSLSIIFSTFSFLCPLSFPPSPFYVLYLFHLPLSMSFIFFNFPFYILSILSPSPSITFIFYDIPLYLYLFPPYPFKIFLKLNVFIFRIVFQANISFTGYVKINHLFCTFTFLSHLSFPLIPFNHQVSKIFWLVRFFFCCPPPPPRFPFY